MHTLRLTLAAASSALLVAMGACSGQSSGDDNSNGDDAAADSSGDSAANRDATSSADASAVTDASRDAEGDASSDAAMEAGCFISGSELASGASNPTNDCQSCQPAVSPSMFSALSDGTSCGDAGICHSGECGSGCEIASTFYANATPNPTNACQTCEPTASTTAWTALVDGTACGNGEICSGAVCGSECDIGGAIVASAAVNASNVCQSCQPGTSTTAWTTTNGANAQCPSGDVCSGTCQPGCFIGGAYYASGATANNGCEVCQPATSTTSWTLVSGAASCGTGQVCNAAGSCAAGCSISGTYYANGATANSGCQVCNASVSTTSFTNASGAGTCSAGEACNAGSCSAGCSIGGTFYGSGASINNACESCAPAKSTTTWTNATDGLSCTASQVCVAGACGAVTAVTVPFAPLNPSLPHPVIAGQATTVKGIALNGATQYRWDFGDGTSSGTLSVADPNNLALAHTYTGNIGQLYVATLTVKTSTASASAVYPVQIADPNAIPDPHIDVAVDAAFWYLHINATRATFAAGAPGYGQPYAYLPDLVSTCATAEAFERRHSNVHLPITTDPYSEDVRRLANDIFYNLSSSAIATVGSENPDSNGNGIGLVLPGSDYAAPAPCGQAIGLIGDAAYVVPVGGAQVYGQTLGTVAQDLTDWVVYAQNGSGASAPLLGGWGYSANDNDSYQYETGWALTSLLGYQRLGVIIPSFVRSDLASWVASDRQTGTTAPTCGGWGFNPSFSYPTDNLASADGILEELFAGLPVSKAALGNLYNNWDSSSDNCNVSPSGETYMIAAALRAANVVRVSQTTCNETPTGLSFPWFATDTGDTHTAIATKLLAQQNADGHWSNTGSGSGVGSDCASPALAGATAWGASTLTGEPAVVEAKICNCNLPIYGVNQAMVFDGTCSAVIDPSNTSLTYAWDYTYSGGTFVQSVDSSNAPVAGVTVTKPDGFATYTQDASGNPTGVTHPVALQVTDGHGNTSVAVCNAIITPTAHCPIANIGGGASHTYQGFINSPLSLDATGSSSPAGDPLTYAWDFENLNSFSDSTSSTPMHTWTSNGTYPIELQVTAHPSALPACTVTAYGTVHIGL